MSGTHVTQVRKPAVIDGGTKYQLSAQCTDAGTLPDTGIFLFLVVQPEDPKNDAFQRIVDVVDFTQYGTSRQASITSGEGYYRSAYLTISYDDIATANGGRTELDSRINALVSNYDTYITAFLTPDEGSDIIYPVVDEGTKNALIAVYQATLPLVTAAEDVRDAEQVECDKKQFELTALQMQLTEATSDLNDLLPVQISLASLVPIYSGAVATTATASASARTLVNGSAASSTDKGNINSQLSTIDGSASQLSTANSTLVESVQTPLGVLVGTLQSRVTDLTRQVNAKQLEVNDCLLQGAQAQAAVDQARAERDQALADVRAVCTDYTP